MRRDWKVFVLALLAVLLTAATARAYESVESDGESWSPISPLPTRPILFTPAPTPTPVVVDVGPGKLQMDKSVIDQLRKPVKGSSKWTMKGGR